MTEQYNFLFYVVLSYSFAILKPLEAELKKRGHNVAWFVMPDTEAARFADTVDNCLQDLQAVMDYQADATFVPGNNVPPFFPGIKVQVFHGFDSGKKNTLRVRHFFDLYCTECPETTRFMLQQREKRPTYDVVETGWPKLDPLLQNSTQRVFNNGKQTILYAPTFSPSLTSTYDLFPEIERLNAAGKWNWLVKFHPKATAEEIAMYKGLQGEQFKVIETPDVLPLLQEADVMLSDTSSIVSEFAYQMKPSICYNNRQPRSWMIHFTEATELEDRLSEGLEDNQAALERLEQHFKNAHPFRDGQSSARVANATEELIRRGTQHLARKPGNFFRNYKLKKDLKKKGLTIPRG